MIVGDSVKFWTEGANRICSYRSYMRHTLVTGTVVATSDRSEFAVVLPDGVVHRNPLTNNVISDLRRSSRYAVVANIDSFLNKNWNWFSRQELVGENDPPHPPPAMNGDDFAASIGSQIYSSFYPAIRTPRQACSALINIRELVGITPEQLRFFEIFANTAAGNVPDPRYEYHFCSTCRVMVGHANHLHCAACNRPHLSGTHCQRCDRCNTCCRCPRCPNCAQRISAPCTLCGRCPQCCGCRSCARGCGRTINCDVCQRCRRCCNCPRVHAGSGAQFIDDIKVRQKKFNCSRLIGVEWEYNHCTRPATQIQTWVGEWNGGIHYDGSCGSEAVTSPMAGDYVIDCLSQLGKALTDAGAVMDQRCSVHVHVDARDLYWEDMYRLLKMYAHVEPALYIMAGQDRLGSRYCKPCGAEYLKALESPDKKGAVLSVAFSKSNGRAHQRLTPGKRDAGRYRGLNLCPWLAGRMNKAPDTTVEFRLHRNTSESEQVIGWAKLCARMVDWAATASDLDVEKLPTSAIRALTIVAPDCRSWIVERLKAWRKETQRHTGVERRIHFKEGKYLYNT